VLLPEVLASSVVDVVVDTAVVLDTVEVEVTRTN